MRRSWRRLVLAAVAVAVLGSVLVFAFWPQPIPVDLAAVSVGSLQVTIDEEGETRVKDVYVVSSPLAGRVLRINRDVGDAVVAGETVLASILPTDPTLLDSRSHAEADAAVKTAVAARDLSQADVARAGAELDFARSDLERARPLRQRNTISQRALERAELDMRTREAALATALAALRMREFELETARARLIEPGDRTAEGESATNCCVTVRAPVSGLVMLIFRESEGVVEAGAPLVEIGDPHKLEIVVDLLSSDAVKVAPGAAVTIEEWGGEASLAGRVRRVEPYGFTKVSALGIEEQRVNVIVDFIDPPEARLSLGHGYRVEARIILWRDDAVLRLPVSALFRDGDAWATFVVEGDRARLRRVAIGHRNDAEAEVRDGLVEGDLVVLYPSDRVGEGARLVARE